MGYVAQAIDKGTGYFGTCTICDSKQDAQKYAKYYRSVGYNAKVFSEDEYPAVQETNAQERREQAIQHFNSI